MASRSYHNVLYMATSRISGPRLRQGGHPGQEVLPVLGIPEDGRPFDPSHHHVVEGAGGIQASLTWHGEPIVSQCAVHGNVPDFERPGFRTSLPGDAVSESLRIDNARQSPDPERRDGLRPRVSPHVSVALWQEGACSRVPTISPRASFDLTPLLLLQHPSSALWVVQCLCRERQTARSKRQFAQTPLNNRRRQHRVHSSHREDHT